LGTVLNSRDNPLGKAVEYIWPIGGLLPIAAPYLIKEALVRYAPKTDGRKVKSENCFSNRLVAVKLPSRTLSAGDLNEKPTRHRRLTGGCHPDCHPWDERR